MSEAAIQAALQQVERFPARASAWLLLGRSFFEARRWPAAVEASRQAVRLDPASAGGWTLYGLSLRHGRQLEEGRKALRRAADLTPEDAVCWGNLASAHESLGELEEAESAAARAVALAPDSAAWHAVLGTTRRALGKLDGAIAAYDRAQQLDPADPRIPWNRALAHLAAHDFRRGFPAYESRRARTAHRPLPMPIWEDGAPPADGVLVHCEQGFGDTLQWARFLPRLARCTGRVVVAAPGRLKAMLERVDGVDAVISKEAARADGALADLGCGVHVGLMSLGARLEEDGETLAEGLPLWAPPLVEQRPYMGGGAARVAICWQGNPAYERDHLRSPPLRHFAPLLATARARGVSVVSLQKIHGVEQLREAGGLFSGVPDLGAGLDTGEDAFVDTAAAMTASDLVITSDTATAHLAGSLATDTWLLLSRPADWRWGHAPGTTPWYPRVRLFRQPRPGDWPALFASVDRALAAWIDAR